MKKVFGFLTALMISSSAFAAAPFFTADMDNVRAQPDSNRLPVGFMALMGDLTGTGYVVSVSVTNTGNGNIALITKMEDSTIEINSQISGTVVLNSQISGSVTIDSTPEMTVVYETFTPAVTAGAYTANDVVGLMNQMAIGATYSNFLIQNITIVDNDQQKKDLAIVFYDNGPDTPEPDNDPWANGPQELRNIVAIVDVQDTDYFDTAAGDSVAFKGNIAAAVSLSSTTLNFQVIAVEAPTFLTTTSFQISVGIVPK